jgi:hypothetical protein
MKIYSAFQNVLFRIAFVIGGTNVIAIGSAAWFNTASDLTVSVWKWEHFECGNHELGYTNLKMLPDTALRIYPTYGLCFPFSRLTPRADERQL